MKIKYQIPDLYHTLFPSGILEMDPVETIATCETCAMAPPRREVKEETIWYQDNLKCCTYHPFLPNYLLGALFSDSKTPEYVLAELRRKITVREFALPIGMTAPSAYQIPFTQRTEFEFGQREDWLCPYFNKASNNCGIWRYRDAVCTGFICQSSYGKKGENFWTMLEEYLAYVELALLEESLIRMDFSPREISVSLPLISKFEGEDEEVQSMRLTEDEALSYWKKDYYKDQESFYKKTYEIVCALTPHEFKEAMGEQGMILEKELFASYKKMLGKK